MTPSSEPAAGFDPLVGWGAGEHVHEPLIQSTLIATDDNLAFVNDLATDYGCSEDGLTWTFHIREDVMFTDGVPLTGRGRGLHHQRHRERRSGRGGSVHGGRGAWPLTP